MGLTVESVERGSQADKQEIRPGDKLLRWKLGTLQGQIESPFDLPYLRFEYAPRAMVTVYGVSGKEPRIWQFDSDIWGMMVRPPLSDKLMPIYNQAAELLAAGQPVRAAERFQTAVPLARKQGPAWLAPWFLSRASQALFQASEWDQADAVYEQAIQEAATAGPITRGELLRQLASGFAYRDDFINAAKYYDALLLEWQDRKPSSLIVANALLGLAEINFRQFELDQAETRLQRASAIVGTLAPNSVQMVIILDDFGILFEQRGNFVRADASYRKALAIEERARPGSRTLANILTNLGTLAHQQGDLKRAEGYHRRALTIAEKIERGQVQLADILSNLGECLLELGDRNGAARYHLRALSLRREIAPTSVSTASSLASLGKIARINGDLPEAQKYYEEASEMARKAGAPAAEIARFRFGEAEVQKDRRDFIKAEELYRQGLSLLEKTIPRSIAYAEAMAQLAGVLHQEKRLEDAAQLYDKALEILARTSHLAGYGKERSLYRATHSEYPYEYAEVLLEMGRQDLAFQILDASHAQTLREMLLETQVDVRQRGNPALLKRQRILRSLIRAKSEYQTHLASNVNGHEQVSAVDGEIDDLVAQYEEVSAQLRVRSPDYAALTDPQPLSLKDIQELLDDDTLLLEYALGKEHSYVWAVTRNTLSVHELPTRTEIEKLARNVYELLITPRHQPQDETIVQVSSRRTQSELKLIEKSAALSQAILGPVAHILQNQRLLIVSDGPLRYIPFAALPVPSSTKSNVPRQTRYLLLDHEIVTLPSASVVRELRRQQMGRPRAPLDVAVFADPVFESSDERISRSTQFDKPSRSQQLARNIVLEAKSLSDDRLRRAISDFEINRGNGFHLSRLLYTRREAAAIMAVVQNGRAMEALDFQANRKRAMSPAMSRYRVIHFATHALLNNEHPELSGLVLSLVDQMGHPQEGFLELQDIYNLRLPVDLVVLSACDTALGQEVKGEGLIGLTRGFMYAGATRVVASLWSVDDSGTSELMARFYKAMERDHLRPAAALRVAQIQMLRQQRWKSPFYWAAFQIHGDWQ